MNTNNIQEELTNIEEQLFINQRKADEENDKSFQKVMMRIYKDDDYIMPDKEDIQNETKMFLKLRGKKV